MAERPSSSDRLQHIDKLKALAMLLVIMGHCIFFCMYHEGAVVDPAFSVICTFHVPLFFFLSGIVVKHPPTWPKFIGKARRFLVPMLVVGLVNAVIIGRIHDFFLNSGHNGYWYLLTLTVFYLLLIPFRLVEHEMGMRGFMLDSALAIAIWLALAIFNRIELPWLEPLNPGGAFAFWPYFIMGYIARKYRLTNSITGKPWLTVLLTLAYLSLLTALFSRLDYLPMWLSYTTAFTAIATLVAVFHSFNNSNTIADRQLLLIGNRTLDIYIYHYFFICFIDLTLLRQQSLAVELAAIIPLSIAIAYGSIALGAIVKHAGQLIKSRFPILLLILFPLRMSADGYDMNNFPPVDQSAQIGQTNLPIVFINTASDSTDHTIIHKDWRVAVRMKIINNSDGINYGDTIAHPGQTVDYDGWIAIRYRGNTSFDFSPKKSYNFKTMKTADVDGEKLKASLIGMPKDNTWVLLSSYSDCSLLRDVLMFQLARPYFDYTPRCRYCELVLDGIYYGIFILAENIRKSSNRLNLDDPGTSGDELTGGYQLQIDRNDEEHYYTSKYFALDSNGKKYSAYNRIYFQYKHPEYEEMTPEQLEYIHRRIDTMEDVLASDDFADPDHGYRQYLDPLSFIDQQLSQEFSGNVDGYRLSTNIYKHRDSEDGRFKTALWDFNLAFGNSSNANAKGTDFWRYQNSYLTAYNAFNKVPFWWMRLMEDPEYVALLNERWAQYRQENYSIRHIVSTIDSITSLLKQGGALERNNMVWNMFKNSTYDQEISRLKQWIAERVNWMDRQLGYEDMSAVTTPSANDVKRISGYYNLQGIQFAEPPCHGIFIVRYRDGRSKKIRRP